MIDSYETEELMKLIAQKKKYLEKVENATSAKYLQKEIMFLEKDILPIVMRNTQILHGEVGNWAVKCFDEFLRSKIPEYCNGMMLYLHFNNNTDIIPNFAFIPGFSSIGFENIEGGFYNINNNVTLIRDLKTIEEWIQSRINKNKKE